MNEHPRLPDFMSLEFTADLLTIPNPEILRRMARAGKIGYIKQGAKYVFTPEIIAEYKAHNTVPQILPHPSGMTQRSLKRARAGR